MNTNTANLNPLFNPNITLHEIDYTSVTAEHFKEALSEYLIKARAEHEREALEAPLTYKALVESSTNMEHLMALWQYMSHLNMAMQTPEIRAIDEEFTPKLMSFTQELAVDARMYNKFKTYSEGEEYKTLSTDKQKMIKDTLVRYEKEGVALSEGDKAKLKKLTEELSELQSKFTNNLVDTNAGISLEFTKKQLAGLPERALGDLGESVRVEGGEEVFSVAYTSGLFEDISKYALDATTRKRVYEAELVQGVKEGLDNRPLMAQIAALFHKKAQILGFDNFASFNMTTNMVKEPGKALEFINDLASKSFEAAKEETKSVSEYGAKILGVPVEFYDRSFVVNRMKKDLLQLDVEAQRQYFPVKNVVAGLFDIVENLYDIKFVENDKKLWVEDAKSYSVVDNKTGQKMGELCLDLFKREFKSEGAWMHGVVGRSQKSEGALRLPVAYIICNAPKGMGEPTFEFEEIVTLFHEMGHALHHLLTKVDLDFFAGINQVQHDAVELPSQFMENFCWDYEVLTKLSSHVETGAKLPREMFDLMLKSKNFLSANAMLTQAKYGLLDMQIYSDVNASPIDVEADVFNRWATREVDTRSHLAPTFKHIFTGGYGAGYYAYKWAEVLSSDSFAALKESGSTYMEQKGAAARFREHILEVGGVRDMNENFLEFRGRSPEITFLLEDSGIKVDSPANKVKLKA